MAFRGNRCSSRWAGLMLVCGVALCAPRLSWATCGDYLSMPGHHGAHAAGDHSTDKPLPVKPCRGPQCRGSLPPSSPPAPFSIERPSDHWALAFMVGDDQSRATEPLKLAEGIMPAVGHPSRIDRPPR